MNRKTLWFSLILLLGAGLSIFLMIAREHQTEKTKPTGGVNAFMVQAKYVDYDKDGALHSQLEANQMKHYVKQDTSLFTKPKILIYTEDRTPWYITSDYGKSQNGTKKVLLYSNVTLYQPPKPNHPETTITTSELTVYPKRSFAETDKKVKIKRPGTVIHGKGIEANLKTGIVRLLTQSRGT
ncbi:MAG: LPS export ABC transporter periplasmic protein LptC, partial [Coxiellaceae bacterium]|nr:LPS export ABC transporter periplasmic protein LptC [Coxiellaceae bacterium]